MLSQQQRTMAALAAEVAEPRCGESTTWSSCQQPRLDLRLSLEHVERRTGDLSGAQGIDQGGLVDERAAPGVDEQGRRLHPPQRGGVDQMAAALVERRVQRHDVGGLEQLVELDEGGPGVGLSRSIAMAVVVAHVHGEAGGSPSHRPADLPEADDAERGPVDG